MKTSSNAQQIFKTTASHRTEYEHPIKLQKGESVTLGERAPEENWKDWIWAENNRGTGDGFPFNSLIARKTEVGEQCWKITAPGN